MRSRNLSNLSIYEESIPLGQAQMDFLLFEKFG